MVYSGGRGTEKRDNHHQKGKLMDATRTAGSVLRATATPSLTFSIILTSLACLSVGIPHAAHAQTGTGGMSTDLMITGGGKGFRYQNEVPVDVGHVRQEYWQLPLSRPDRQLIDRKRWAGGINYTHTFEDRVYDREQFMEVSQRMQPLRRLSVNRRQVRAMAAEPGETWLAFCAAGTVTPSFGLGGSIGLGQGERTVSFDGDDSVSGEKTFTWLYTATGDIRVSRRVMLRESVSM